MSRGYATQKPHFEILEVLAGIAAWQDSQWKGKGKRWGRVGAWCIVRQRVIRAWYARVFDRHVRPGADMSRRTLQYQLAGLRRAGFLESVQRHTGQRNSNKLALRPSIYKFTSRARLWIKRRQGWVENPFGLLAAQKIAQSDFNPELVSSTSLSRAVDKTSTAPGASRQGKTAALRRRVKSSAARRATPAPAKARSEKESKRATAARAARSGQGRGRTAERRPRRSKRAVARRRG